jgi:hypothetical protein
VEAVQTPLSGTLKSFGVREKKLTQPLGANNPVNAGQRYCGGFPGAEKARQSSLPRMDLV